MRITTSRCLLTIAGALALASPFASAQISLSTAVDLALRNSPKVKMAQADVDKARASLSEARDAYIPAVSTTGGYGQSSGVPLGLPVVFSVTAQSLAFNFSQKDYIRAAAAGVSAASLALNEVRSQVAEDTVTTYVSLNNALRRRSALAQSTDYAGRLVQIVQDRFDTGVDAHIEVTKSHRTATQLRLQKLLVDDEIASLSAHLTKLTSVTGPRTETVPDSIPEFAPPGATTFGSEDSYGIKAAFAGVVAKNFVARGDSRYRLRPQVGFSAGYSRISTFGTNYILYYPGFNPKLHPDISYNSFDIGVQVVVPIFDLVHQAKARGSAAEAAHARFDAENQHDQFEEGQLKLQHAAAELSARSELASLDRDLAQDQLDAIELQLKAAAGSPDSPQMTPKDEQNARLQERQRFIEYLDAELQLRQTQISLMRQTGQLGDWLHLAITPQPGVAPTALPTSVRPVSATRP